MKFFAPCPKGFEYLLVDELKALGAEEVHEALAGVHFEGELEVGYRALLWSRLASRVLLVLQQKKVDTVEELYEAAQNLPWAQHMRPTDTLCVDFNGRSEFIRHTQFGAQKVKDAICDAFLAVGSTRPSVDTEKPTLRLNAHLDKQKFTLTIDLSGHALHERGYRARAGEAPIKENLAAAMLLRARWPEVYAQGGFIVDPMCGAGTILLEAAAMAADMAPGLWREDFGCTNGWLKHDATLWATLRAEMQSRADAGVQALRKAFFGFDMDARVLNAAEHNAAAAQLQAFVQFYVRPLATLTRPAEIGADTTGLVICNPPYGERLGTVAELNNVYRLLGQKMLSEFSGFSAAIITSEDELARAIGVRSHKQYQLFNGALPCKLYLFELKADNAVDLSAPKAVRLSEQAEGLRNRIEKNRKALAPWLKKEGIECYRVYDADIPEYSAAIDVYGDQLFIQEYAAPKTIPEAVAEKRFQDIVTVAKVVFNVKDDAVHLRERRRQKGKEQYQKQREKGEYFKVSEGGLKFWVNLDEYLDTGLFLDHRSTRAMVRDLMRKQGEGKHFLNLFSYTGSVSVYAADGGALTTTSVDLSRTYSEWAADNMDLNRFHPHNHRFIQDNVMDWLAQCRDDFDLIFVDPPTFSNSKKMEGVFDVQRDHVALLRRALELLNPGGVIVFSNNFRRFKLDETAFEDCVIEDISKQTIPEDFQRNARIHQCWLLRRR